MGNSRLRPETTASDKPAPSNGTAYYMIWGAVQHQSGLIHGKLHARGEHCAIGSFFATNPTLALPYELIDEVAMVNDSVPAATPKQRRQHVLRWLKWRLTQLGLKSPGRKSVVQP